MRFQHYDRLRTFGIVARHDSFAAAADVLNLTKGAVSHRIRGLERALGFALSNRLPRGIILIYYLSFSCRNILIWLI